MGWISGNLAAANHDVGKQAASYVRKDFYWQGEVSGEANKFIIQHDGWKYCLGAD